MEDNNKLTVTEKQKSLDINTETGTVEEGESIVRKTVSTIEDIVALLTSAVNAGQITPQQARRIRASAGIHNSYFTKKQTTPEERKAKRKQQQASRKKNRGRVKGEKRSQKR